MSKLKYRYTILPAAAAKLCQRCCQKDHSLYVTILNQVGADENLAITAAIPDFSDNISIIRADDVDRICHKLIIVQHAFNKIIL